MNKCLYILTSGFILSSMHTMQGYTPTQLVRMALGQSEDGIEIDANKQLIATMLNVIEGTNPAAADKLKKSVDESGLFKGRKGLDEELARAPRYSIAQSDAYKAADANFQKIVLSGAPLKDKVKELFNNPALSGNKVIKQAFDAKQADAIIKAINS